MHGVIMMVLVQGRTLEVALEALLRGAESHIDPATRKTCVQVPSPHLCCGVPNNQFCISEHLGGPWCYITMYKMGD